MGDVAEREILLSVVHASARKHDAALSQFSAPLNWDYLLNIARVHGLIPLLAAAMSGLESHVHITDQAKKQVRLLACASAMRSDVLFDALTEVLGAMDAAGARHLVLKGPALASTIYAERTLRPFSDLDLLCSLDHLRAADAALRQIGYVPRAHSAREQADFHIVYQRERDAVIVELHSDLLQLGLRTRCMDKLWQRAEAFVVGERQALMLGLEEQLLHICVHLHTHGYTRLLWFKDLDLLMRQRGHEVNWTLLARFARDEGVTLSIRHALLLIRELLGTPLPTDCLRHFQRDPLGEFVHAVLWPHRRIVSLESKQRLRSLRFNPRLGLAGVVPSLVVMGRRREKLAALGINHRRRTGISTVNAGKSQPECNLSATDHLCVSDTLDRNPPTFVRRQDRMGKG